MRVAMPVLNRTNLTTGQDQEPTRATRVEVFGLRASNHPGMRTIVALCMFCCCFVVDCVAIRSCANGAQHVHRQAQNVNDYSKPSQRKFPPPCITLLQPHRKNLILTDTQENGTANFDGPKTCENNTWCCSDRGVVLAEGGRAGTCLSGGGEGGRGSRGVGEGVQGGGVPPPPSERT